MLIGLICAIIAPNLCAQKSQKAILKKAELRLRSIYEKGEYRVKRFRGDWLQDSSGYLVWEQAPKRKRVRYHAATGKRTELDPSQKEKIKRSARISPDGKSRIISEQGNLYVRDLENNKKIPLTNHSPEDSVWNFKATWSPDGKHIVFVQSDESKVRKRSVLVPGDPSYPKTREAPFARVGETIASLRVGVVKTDGSQTRWLSIPTPSEGYYLGQVAWAANSTEVLVEKMSRFRNEREFLLANIRTGVITRIFHEFDPAWVVASYGKNSGLEWIRNGDEFIVLSEMDGWRRAYVYSREGQKKHCLTPEKTDVIERAKVDEAGGWFYYYGSDGIATQKVLFRSHLDGSGNAERVTPQGQGGVHDYQFSPDAKLAFHTYSTFDTPPVTDLVELSKHRVVRVLEDNKALQEKTASLISRPTEFFQLHVGDVSMDAWMLKPHDFDPKRKYPVFLYVYGEPHGQTVMDSWGFAQADFHRVISDLGYLVVSIDNRGTPAPKGAKWRRSIFPSLGPLSTEDQAAALKELGRARPYADMTRVGIWGWSGGGSNTLNAMFRKPDLYHVGIAVAPKPQPHLYNAWFQEIYMETRETNPKGYKQSAPIHFAEGLQGDLLIIHGTGETNTHLQITEGLVDRLIELGKTFDYMAYPNRDHGIHEGPGTTLHLRMLITRYLVEHLPPGPK